MDKSFVESAFESSVSQVIECATTTVLLRMKLDQLRLQNEIGSLSGVKPDAVVKQRAPRTRKVFIAAPVVPEKTVSKVVSVKTKDSFVKDDPFTEVADKDI